MVNRSWLSTLSSRIILNSSSGNRSAIASILNSSAIVSLLLLCLIPSIRATGVNLRDSRLFGNLFLGNRSRVQADWHFQAEQITRVPACSPKPNREKRTTLPPNFHIQTVIFQRGDPIANRPTQKCQKQENQKARLSARFFSSFFDFSACRVKRGKLRQEIQRLRVFGFFAVRGIGYWQRFLGGRWEGAFPNGNCFFHFVN